MSKAKGHKKAAWVDVPDFHIIHHYYICTFLLVHTYGHMGDGGGAGVSLMTGLRMREKTKSGSLSCQFIM